MKVFAAADPASAAISAAGYIGAALRDAIARRGRASVAFSGGSSPIPLLDSVARLDLAWDRVTVLQVDERWVGAASPDRNLGALLEHLVRPTGAASRPLTVTDADASLAEREHAAAADSASLCELLGPDGVIDVVHLGLGTDGHTASWPPGEPTDVLAADPALVAAVADFNGFARSTLTPAAVVAAHHVVWFVPGEAKRTMLERLVRTDPGIPAGRVPPERAVVFTDVI